MPFTRIAGHRRVLTLLSRAIARGTLPPALLLAGPHGVGKRRAAVAIAETLNCLAPRSSDVFEADACGECASCRRIARAVHSDVIVVEPGDTGTIKIEQTRDIVTRSEFRPFEGRRRVVIVDEADAMVPAAQSALLKTLEEPPSATVFVLVSSMPDALLPTVLSRCPRMRFAPLTTGELVRTLVSDHDYSEADARAAAVDADGSLAVALESQSADVTGARDTARQLLESTARGGDPARGLDAAKDLTPKGSSAARERDQLAVTLRALASMLRDMGIIATRADMRMLANADLEPELSRLSASFDRRRASQAFSAVDEALAALERNASPKVVADWLVLQL